MRPGVASRTIDACGTRGRRRSALRAARRPGAARRRVVPGGRGREGRAGRRERRRQDHPAEDHHRRARPARGSGHPFWRARRDAPDGRHRARRRADRRRPAALGEPAPDPRRRGRGRPVRAGADGDRRREDPARLRPRARRVRRRGRLRARGHLGRLHRQGPRRALRPRQVPRAAHALRRRAEAAGAGVPARRPGRGAAARRAGQLPRRAGQGLARGPDQGVRQDDPVHQPRPRAAGQHRDPRGHRRARRGGQHGVDPPGRVRVVPRGAQGPLPALRGACAAGGTRSTRSSRRWCSAQDQGRVQRRHGEPVQGRPDPAPEVRGGRPADRAAARAAGEDAAQGRPHRQARRGLRGPRADRPDEAVRPRGLVRRAGGRARLERLRQVPLPAAARHRRQRP